MHGLDGSKSPRSRGGMVGPISSRCCSQSGRIGSGKSSVAARRPTIDVAALELIIVELPGVVGGGMPGRGAADKAESLAGCKSPYRQLPVFGRLAYPGRAAATTHERPGRKSPSALRQYSQR